MDPYYINRKIGNLTIISKSPKKGRRNVECSCGNMLLLGSKELNLKIADLENKGFAACNNCTKIKFRDNRSNADKLRYVYNAYRKSAKDRKYDFNLSREEFTTLISTDCYYCGNIPSNSRKDRLTEEMLVYGGVDRIDNTIGYEIDNVVPCCKSCNRMKQDLTLVSFLQQCESIYKRTVQRSSRRGVGSSDPKRRIPSIQQELGNDMISSV